MFVLHDILRLQITVDYSGAVRRFQCQANLPDDFNCLLRRKLPLVELQPPQIRALDEFHADEFHAIHFGQVVDANHIPVRHLSRGQQLLLEPPQNGRVCRHLRANQFQRNDMVHFPVKCFVDRAHAPFSEHVQNLKAAAEHVAGLQLVLFRKNIRKPWLPGGRRRGWIQIGHIACRSI